MILRHRPPLHLAYCLNVHRGETWADHFEAIRTHALKVRASVAPDRPFGLGLRLGHTAAEELAKPEQLAAFQRFLAEHDLYVFTINGFPYGAFHDTAVKERVYAPDWRTDERLAYTTRLADILAQLLPDGTPGSISTVPGSYRTWIRTDADREAVVRNLAACATHLEQVETATGRHITLALEPEPDCLFDTTAGTVEFFNVVLADHPAMHSAGANWRRYVGVCLDACHLSVQFEDPAASFRALRANDIAVPKVHLSAALRAPAGPATASRLASFAEGTYLHQTRIRGADGTVRTWPDLTKEALKAIAGAPDGEVRVHVHVPLYFDHADGLHSTAGDLCPAFFRSICEAGIPHLEIETYTFHVLPADMAAKSIEESIADEYRWVIRHGFGESSSGSLP